MKMCNGPCEQGRKACPCPMACEEPEDEAAIKRMVGCALRYSAIAMAGAIAGAVLLSCIR